MSIESDEKRSACYLSTPEHIGTFYGRCIYIYTDKGELTLANNILRFVGKNGSDLELDIDQIVKIRIGHFSRWAKPIRLDYISITYCETTTKPTILLTPTRHWSTPVWETNKIINKWVGFLENARSRT